jgi:hypothetical protein
VVSDDAMAVDVVAVAASAFGDDVDDGVDDDGRLPLP